jgi:hypothetical protein
MPSTGWTPSFVAAVRWGEFAVHHTEGVVECRSQLRDPLAFDEHPNVIGLQLSADRVDERGCREDVTVLGVELEADQETVTVVGVTSSNSSTSAFTLFFGVLIVL